MTPAGIASATEDADEATALASLLDGRARPVALTELDSPLRPIDRLAEEGLGAFTHLVQRYQDVIDRMTGKAEAVRTFADAWHTASTELAEALTGFDSTLRTDTAEWAGEGAGAWRTRARELLAAMRGSVAAAKATAAVAVAMGETVAEARKKAAEITDNVVDWIIGQVRAAASIQGMTTTEVLARVERTIHQFEPTISQVETGLTNTVAEFRTSRPSRLQHQWQRLGLWFGAIPRNAVEQTPPTDAERGDFGRGGAYLDGDTIRLVPRNPDIPSVTLPNNVGAEGFEIGPRWNVLTKEHHYDVRTDTDIPFDQASGFFAEAIAEDPVPADGDTKGRPEGVANDAGLGNMVRTYTYPSPDPSRYTDITVNYTLGDKHILQEGYVIRFGERMPDGTTQLVSYGEGDGIVQHPLNLPAHGVFGLGWKDNHADIVETVKHRMTMPAR